MSGTLFYYMDFHGMDGRGSGTSLAPLVYRVFLYHVYLYRPATLHPAGLTYLCA